MSREELSVLIAQLEDGMRADSGLTADRRMRLNELIGRLIDLYNR